MNDILYIKADEIIRVTVREVTVGDLGEIWCADRKLMEDCRKLSVLHMDGSRYTCSIVDVVRVIADAFPQVMVTSLGEQDFVIEYKPHQKHSRLWEYLKLAFVWLVIFCGAAFAIATFNEDVSVIKVFAAIHEGITGRERTGFTWLEGGYALGLSGGILIFYNHISKKKADSDPTPLEVEMRTYEKDLYTTMIADKQRKERERPER